MSDSREASISDNDSISSKSVEIKSLFGRLVNYFTGRTQNKKNESVNYSKRQIDSVIKLGKINKHSNRNKGGVYTKRSTEERVKNLNDLTITERQGKHQIRPPINHSLELEKLSSEHTSNYNSQENDKNTRQGTHESRQERKPRVIRLGQRRAIRINPNSSTSSISLSQAENSSPISKPNSPSISSPSPQAESFSNPRSKVPSIYDILHSSEIGSHSHQIDVSNASTPYKSRSQVIRVNTMDELDDEPVKSKANILDHYVKSTQNLILDQSYLQELEVDKDFKKKYSTERKKRKKKSKGGHKLRKTSKTLKDQKHDLLQSHSPDDERKLSEGGLNADLTAVNVPLNDKLYNAFYLDEKVPSDIEVHNETILNTIASLKTYSENRRNLSESISPQLQLKRPSSHRKNKTTNEENSIAHDTHKDLVGLKWPGYNSIEEINLPDTPSKTIRITKNTETNVVSNGVNNSSKSRLLSDIMAERYKKDGILFQGKFKTNHLASINNQISGESISGSEKDLTESPIIQKFGVDIRKERNLRQGKIID